MWHGTPLKSIFYADSGESESNLKKITKLNDKTSYFLVSSKLERELIAKSFRIDREKIRCTGHPRNDVLFTNASPIIPSLIKEIPDYNKIILYCPTYRRHGSLKLFPFEDMDFDHLNHFLEENKLIILIRGHVFDRLDGSSIYSSKRIIDFSHEICNDINEVLSEINILITDYSSVYIDYLILDRPCIFIPYDLEHYLENRGLLLDDYDFWAPGDKLETYRDFIDAINDILHGIDRYKHNRREVSRKLNRYDNGNASKNVFELINDKFGDDRG